MIFLEEDVPFVIKVMFFLGTVILIMGLMSCTPYEEVFFAEEAIKVIEDVENEIKKT
jgi:hypothetical protein